MKSPRAVEAQFECAGCVGLYRYLSDLAGQYIAGRYEVVSPYYAGGQGLLLLARDQKSEGREKSVLLKFPNVDYSRPAYIDSLKYQQMAAGIRREAEVLSEYGGAVFPEMVERIEEHSMLLPGAFFYHAGREICLVIKFIPGVTFSDIRGPWNQLLREGNGSFVESLAIRVMLQICDWMELLLEADPPLVYTDLSLDNILLPAIGAGEIFCLLDAGSVTPASEPARGFHLRYLPPHIKVCDVMKPGKIHWEARLVIQQMARMVYELTCGKAPVAGELLDMNYLDAAGVSRELSSVISQASSGVLSSVADLKVTVSSIRGASLSDLEASRINTFWKKLFT